MKKATQSTWGLAALSLILTSCGDDDNSDDQNQGTPAVVLTSLSITPSPVMIQAGATQQLTVNGTLSDGSTSNVTSEATFISNNTATATVDPSGLVSGVAEGGATIVVEVGTVSDMVTVTVTAAPAPMLTSISVTPETANLETPNTQQLTVTGTFDDSSTSDQTGQATFASSDDAVATVNAQGLVTSVGAGTAMITATVGNLDDSMMVTVTVPPPPMLESIAVTPNPLNLNPGATGQLVVTGTFDDTTTSAVTGESTFMSADTAIATVSATGEVTAVAIGNTTITAMSGGFSDTTAVTVADFPEIQLPMAVDDFFADRAQFGDGGATHTADNVCPSRAPTMGFVGLCHRIIWDGATNDTGEFWTDGGDFPPNGARARQVQTGATEVRFYAWAEMGAPRLTFGPGINGSDLGEDRIIQTLSTTPTEYVVPLTNNLNYSGVFGAFSFAANNAENPTGFTIFIDSIQWVRGPTTLRADPADITIWDQGGNPAFEAAGPAAGGTAFGAPAAGSSYVIPFVLPNLPPGGSFTSGNLTIVVENVDAQMGTTLNADLYGLTYRSANDAMMNGVVQLTDGYVGAAVDTSATLIQDNFFTPTTPGLATPANTDAAGDMNLVNYINAQVMAGAQPGDYIYFRLSPDADHPIGAPATTFIVSAAADNLGPPNRPTLTLQ